MELGKEKVPLRVWVSPGFKIPVSFLLVVLILSVRLERSRVWEERFWRVMDSLSVSAPGGS